MASYMEEVGKAGEELTVEERNLLSVAYKNAVGSRRAAWRIITSVEQKEKTKGNEDNASFAKEYCVLVETELQKICDTILELLDKKLIPTTPSGESKVFYVKMKADYFRYIAEFTDGEKKQKASQDAKAELDNVAEDSYKDSTLIMQLLRDNLTLWTSDGQDGGEGN